MNSTGCSLLAVLACWLFASNAAAQPPVEDDEGEPVAVTPQAATDTQAPVAPSATDKPWRPAYVTIYGHLAPTGGPAGVLGGSIEITPDPVVSFELGAGAGGAGPQIAANMWLRPEPSPTSALLVGAGVSGGAYADTVRNFASEREPGSVQGGYKTAVWFNPQIAVEVLWPGGFRLRPYFGASFLLNSSSFTCGSDPRACPGEKSNTAKLLPIVGLQIGGAFPN